MVWVGMQATQRARGLPQDIQTPADSGARTIRCFDVSEKVEAGSGPWLRNVFRLLCDMTDDLFKHDTTSPIRLQRRMGTNDVDAECPRGCKNKWHLLAELVVQILQHDP